MQDVPTHGSCQLHMDSHFMDDDHPKRINGKHNQWEFQDSKIEVPKPYKAT